MHIVSETDDRNNVITDIGSRDVFPCELCSDATVPHKTAASPRSTSPSTSHLYEYIVIMHQVVDDVSEIATTTTTTTTTTSPGVTGRHGEAWPVPSFRFVPPQIFLSGHANSVLKKQAFIIDTNNVTILAEETGTTQAYTSSQT